MSERQLLASIACSLATLIGMECNPATLIAASRCLWTAMNERQLLASIALSLCNVNGGGGGTTIIGTSPYPPTVPGTFDGQTILSFKCAVLSVWDATAGAWVYYTLNPGVYLGLPTVVELRQRDTYTCVPVFATTTGYAAPFDGQARGYHWDQDSTDAEGVNGAVVPDDRTLSGDPGRWIEIGTL